MGGTLNVPKEDAPRQDLPMPSPSGRGRRQTPPEGLIIPRRTVPDSHYDALPSDVLRLIFAHLPFRPLTLSVSLVCKRWRIIAMRSITSFTFQPRGRTTLPDLATCLPSLKELNLHNGWNDELVLSTSVSTLSFRLNGTAKLRFKPHALSSLSVSTFAEATSIVVPYLRASQATLSHLYLDIELDHMLGHTMATIILPSLTSVGLGLRFTTTTAHLNQLDSFLLSHSSQLRSLLLEGSCNLVTHFKSIPFVALRNLDLRISEINPGFLSALLTNCTALVDLRISRTTAFLGVDVRLMTSLVAISNLRSTVALDNFSPLMSIHGLREIAYSFPLSVLLGSNTCLWTRITVLDVLSSDDSNLIWEAIWACSNVQQLSLPHVPMPPNFNRLILPNLQTLTLYTYAPRHIAVLRALVFSTRRLRRLAIPLSGASQEQVDECVSLLYDAAARSMLDVILYHPELGKEPIDRLLAWAKHSGWMQLRHVISQ